MNTKAAGGLPLRPRSMVLVMTTTHPHQHRSKCDGPQMQGRGRYKLGPGYKQARGVIPFATGLRVLFSQFVRF